MARPDLIGLTHVNLAGVDFDAVAREQARDRTPIDWRPPTVLPPAWTLVEMDDDQRAAAYRAELLGLTALFSCSIEQDERAWLHLSVSHRVRIPSWRELREAKELFLGDREAYSVLPPQARYVNIHPHVLHLFALLDPAAVALPDFTRGTGSL